MCWTASLLLASLNFIHAINFGLTPLGKVWTPLFPSYGLNSTTSRSNNYGCGLRRWRSASGKYTHSSQKSQLHSLEWVAVGIGLHVNADKTEYMCFNQRGDISIIKGGAFETSGQVQLPRKQCLNNWNRLQHATSKDMNSYQLAIGHMEVRPDR